MNASEDSSLMVVVADDGSKRVRCFDQDEPAPASVYFQGCDQITVLLIDTKPRLSR